tara:strand:+ start:479 stop:793 length:315 start_codon:yes stop_codon:yes gene_type:complete
MKANEENLQTLNDMNSMNPTPRLAGMIEAMEIELGINQPAEWTAEHDSCNASFQRICKMIVETIGKNKRRELEELKEIIFNEMQSDKPNVEITKLAMQSAWQVV